MNTIGILSVTCLISALILSIIVATAAPTSSQKLIPDENSIDSNLKHIHMYNEDLDSSFLTKLALSN